MKNLRILIILFVLLLNTPVLSQEPISFRNISLGGVIFDNLDLIYDPIELRFVDSLRIYTNLSNLTSTREQIFNNYSDNELLIGLSRPNPFIKNLWTSLLVRWQDFEYSNFVRTEPGLTGYAITGYGTIEEDYTGYIDLNNDGLYDMKRNVYQRQSNLEHNKNYSVVLNNSYLLQDITIGLKFAFGRRNIESNTTRSPLGTGRYNLLGADYFDPEFSRVVDEFLLDSNYSMLKWSEKGDFVNTFKKPIFDVAAAFMLPVSKLELRGDLFFSMLDEESEFNNIYSGQVEEFNQSITNYRHLYSEDQRYLFNEKLEGIGIGAGASIKYVFNKQISRIYDGYWFLGARYGRQSFDYDNSQVNKFNSIEDIFDGETEPMQDFLETYSSESNSSDIGDGSRNDISITGRINVPLMNDVFFGCGLSYSMSWLQRETRMGYAFNSIRNYTLIDTLTNDDDYVRNISQSLGGSRTYEMDLTMVTIPVGIEYIFSADQKWAFRVGSVFQYLSVEEREALQITDSEPYIIMTEYGDGTVGVQYEDNQYSSNSLNSPTAVSNTFFTYGLGFRATENLQIDLLGFFDVDNNVTFLEFVKYLRFSFSLKI